MDSKVRVKLQEIIDSLDRDGVVEVFRMGKARLQILERQAVFEFKPGETVSFKGRYGRIETGTVVKVNYTRVQVKVGMTTWNVPPTMLIKV